MDQLSNRRNLLEIKNLKKNYGRKSKTEVLKGISLEISDKSVIGLIGENGAG